MNTRVPLLLAALAAGTFSTACGDDGNSRPIDDAGSDTAADGGDAGDAGDGGNDGGADIDAAADTGADAVPDTNNDADADADNDVDGGDAGDDTDAGGPNCTYVPPTTFAAIPYGPPPGPSEALHVASDVAVDITGQIVSVDGRGNIVRIDADGTRTVWVEHAVVYASGLAWLPTGELLVVDAGLSRIIKVYPNGEVRTLVEDLDGPEGLDVDSDGQIYVAEATGGGIAQVDGATGAQRSLVRGLPVSPVSVVLSHDEQRLFFAGRENASVQYLQRLPDGGWSAPRAFGGLPGAVSPCEGASAGDPCTDGVITGRCTDGPDGLFCGAAPSCGGAEIGDPCEDDSGSAGQCADTGFGDLYCAVVPACDGRGIGDACSEFGFSGTCQDDGFGIYCRPPQPCDGLTAGALCDNGGWYGMCADDGVGGLYCGEISSCYSRSEGDLCTSFGQVGECVADLSTGGLVCNPTFACDGLTAGSPCEEAGDRGTCADDGFGLVYCLVDTCAGLADGAACTQRGVPGTCSLGAGRAAPDAIAVPLPFGCIPTPQCTEGIAGVACVGEFGQSGTCADDLAGGLYCQTVGRCDDLGLGAECLDPTRAVSGFCAPADDGGFFCAGLNPCAGVPIGSDCDGGTCSTGPGGQPYCRPPGPCDGLAEGDECVTDWGGGGVCTLFAGELMCSEVYDACVGAAIGVRCSAPDGSSGTCEENARGGTTCAVNSCLGLTDGADCLDNEGAAGKCDSSTGHRVCRVETGCVGASIGDRCTTSTPQAAGACEPTQTGGLACVAASPCAGAALGSPCATSERGAGVCAPGGTDGVAWCRPNAPAVSITSLETDSCGNLYAAESRTGVVWRISADGTSATPVISSQRSPITGLAWATGSALGEYTLLLSARGGTDVLTAMPGYAARAAVRPLDASVTPSGPAPTPAVDCLNAPTEAIAITELDRPTAYHDVAFDDLGYLIGTDLSALIAVNRANQVQLFAPGISGVQGMDWLPDGTLVVAAGSGVVAIAPSGSTRTLADGFYGYGVTVGPDGLIYLGDNSTLYRIDPETAVVQTYLDPSTFGQSWGPRNIDFDPDHDVMYVSAFGDWTWAIALDENYDPVGVPRRFARIRQGVNYQDGLGVDWCGNLFIPNYETSGFYRVLPNGVVRVFKQWEFGQYGHGIEWGNGVGGWSTTSVFLPQPYDGNTVVELEIGVPSRETRLAE